MDFCTCRRLKGTDRLIGQASNNAQKNWTKEKDLRGNNGPGDEEEEDSV